MLIATHTSNRARPTSSAVDFSPPENLSPKGELKSHLLSQNAKNIDVGSLKTISHATNEKAEDQKQKWE